MSESPHATVYYNSACPVCRAGVSAQQKTMQSCGITNVDWMDVHQNPAAVCEIGASLEQVRERLYVKDEGGAVSVGADAFAELWVRTPGQRWLGSVLRWPLVRPLAGFAYKMFARLLYRWNLRRKHW